MNYEEFKKMVIEGITGVLPEELKEAGFKVVQVNKINETLDGLQFNESSCIRPVIYINDMFVQYQKDMDFKGVLQATVLGIQHAIKKSSSILPDIDFSVAKDNIVCWLVNTKQNKPLLDDEESLEFLDLSVIYRWVVKIDSDSIQTAKVSASLIEKIGITKNQLFEIALENTRRLFPPTVKAMNEILYTMALESGLPEEFMENLFKDSSPEQAMWVIGNERCLHGATALLYNDVIQTLAEKVGSSLYIMPSSIHEVIAVSVSMGDPDSLAEMVETININEVDLKDRLSNQVYLYDKETREIHVCTSSKQALA